MPRADGEERFRVIRQLGVGGFGRTLLVEDRDDRDRQVVIKVPLDEETELALVTELINNAALHGSLRGMTHPNLVRYIGNSKFERFHVLVMEYIAGGDLRRLLRAHATEGRPLDTTRALRIFRDACAGLVAAHQINLVHRDIKPENILLQENGRAKLADFGLAKIKQATSRSLVASSQGGTLAYMAPESLRGVSEAQTDVWSMAVTLYEMVTGQVPFRGENTLEFIEAITRAEPESPSRLNPAVSSSLEEVILRGLQKRPGDRYSSAQEMLDAVAPALDQQLRAAHDLFNTGREAEAHARLKELLAANPGEPRVYVAIADLFGRRQQFARAEEILRVGIRACVASGALQHRLATALWNQGSARRSDAIGALEAAVRLGLAGPIERQARALLTRWRAVRHTGA